MGVVVAIVIVLVVLWLVKRSQEQAKMDELDRKLNLSFSDTDLIEYSKKVPEVDSLICRDVSRNVQDQSEYDRNFSRLVDKMYELDRGAAVSSVPTYYKIQTNEVAKVIVKYYTEPILKYGTNAHKKVLMNAVRLLKINGVI